MRRLLVILACAGGVALAESDALLERAERARTAGLPQTVIYDLRSAYEIETDAGIRDTLAVTLARCLIEAGRPAEAAEVLEPIAGEENIPASYWLAVAQASSGDWASALAGFSRIAEIPDPEFNSQARLGKSRAYEALDDLDAAVPALQRAMAGSTPSASQLLDLARLYALLGRYAEAIRTLDSIDGGDVRALELARYFRARINLDLGDAEAALSGFESLADASVGKLRAAAVIGRVDALMTLDRLREAEEVLEHFIDTHPRDPQIALLFEKLDELYAALPDAGSGDLRRWARDTDHPEFASYAAFYLGRYELRAARNEQALAAFLRFGEQRRGHPLRADAIIHAVEMLQSAGRVSEAFEALAISADLPADDPSRPRLQFLRAALNLAAGREVAARGLFLDVSNRVESLRQPAADNALLAEALAGEKWSPADSEDSVEAEFPASDEARLRASMVVARDTRDPAELLRVHHQAQNRAVRARAGLAAAELHASGGRMDEARSLVQQVANEPGVDPESVAALEVFLADDGSANVTATVARMARRFLEQFPGGDRAAEVRMKLGEVLLRSGDARAAWIEFEQAGRNAPDRAFSAAALYSAAGAAARTMDPEALDRAIELYEEVARTPLPLAALARFDQAMIYSQLGRHDEATAILDRLTDDDSLDGQIRSAARMKRADVLFSEGIEQPEKFTRAAEEWEALADASEEASIRNEALTKAAIAHERLGDADAALSRYYRVIDQPPTDEPEYFWYYKAGFDAARLLESQGLWEQAMRVYKKISDRGGPRAAEAEARVKRLRLENFIWD